MCVDIHAPVFHLSQLTDLILSFQKACEVISAELGTVVHTSKFGASHSIMLMSNCRCTLLERAALVLWARTLEALLEAQVGIPAHIPGPTQLEMQYLSEFSGSISRLHTGRPAQRQIRPFTSSASKACIGAY